MSCMYRLGVTFLLLSIIEASPAQILGRPSLILSQPRPLSSALSGLQVPNITLNTTNRRDNNEPDCNAAMYGNPAVSSCLDVYRQMTDSEKESDFGDRTKGIFTYPLPYRLSSADGTCVIDIESLPWAFKDRATMAQMRNAALGVMDSCVLKKRSGGITTGLGQQGNLAITISTYKPDVECSTTALKFPDTRDCQTLLSMMPVSMDEQVFGPQGDPDVEVGLPFDLAGPAGRCGFYFTSSGGPQRRSWRDLWEAATAIFGMCGRKEQQGYAFVGGKFSGAIVALIGDFKLTNLPADQRQSIDIAMYKTPGNLAIVKSTMQGARKDHGSTTTS